MKKAHKNNRIKIKPVHVKAGSIKKPVIKCVGVNCNQSLAVKKPVKFIKKPTIKVSG